MKIAIICGGPGAERGISINSARSMLDHLQSDTIKITPFYVDVFMNVYVLSSHQLYSNTPSDFDFKLQHSAQKISEKKFISELKKHDLAFPLIHGVYGEDGRLQQLLEDNNIPYIGGSAYACKRAFPKGSANYVLQENGFYTVPFALVNRTNLKNARLVIDAFFKGYGLKKAIIKPTFGGSSIGTFAVDNTNDALAALKDSFDKKLNIGDGYIIEPLLHGREFSNIVVQNKDGKPVAFVPTEVEIVKGTRIFNFRKKYLATDSSLLHCPPRFTDKQIEEIQQGSEKIFSLFGFRDFMRVDGWILDDGHILFSDINPVSGMEQNSFMFEQTSRVGFDHSSILAHIVSNACRRYKLKMPLSSKGKAASKKKKVFIIMGGKTAERQVSLMSGTNVWLKLRKSKKFDPVPFLMDKEGVVWQLPYSFALNHSVEEIRLTCGEAKSINTRLVPFSKEIYAKLGIPNRFSVKANTPRRMSLDAFCAEARKNKAFVFVGLHGGEGEDGRFQKKLERYGLVYNGSDSVASRICMDKLVTGHLVNELKDPEIVSLPKRQFNIQTADEKELKAVWDEVSTFDTDTFAIKPLSDGCSSGIVRLYTFQDFKTYAKIAGNRKNEAIPADTFKNQNNEVALPQDKNPLYFIEPFIQVDYIRVVHNDIVYKKKQGWLEFTVGVLEKDGKYHALNPSITIAEGEVLSLEEKFQGGTGVNITPPPESILKAAFRKKIKAGIEKTAKKLGIKNYARIDIFFNLFTGKMIIIEANSLPGMTPSTVIYHQALTETPPLVPLQFIERILNYAIDSVHGKKRLKNK
jgi:D-alanine--D-alanine ligase